MGLFGLPSPLFAWVDKWLGAVLPPAPRLVLWAAFGAILSMELYRLLSPQRRITALKGELEDAKRRLSGHDGDLDDAWPLIGRMLSLALRRVGVVFPATIMASLPLLAVIIWIDSAYGRAFPRSGEPMSVEVGEPYVGRWIGSVAAGPPRVQILNADGGVLADIAVNAPIPVLHKQHWWNLLVGNPAGYLDDASPVELVRLDFPRQEVLSLGPPWMRGWEFVFFLALIGFTLTFKHLRRIE
ncbi:hypothetical protein KXR53_02445 [Inquilinus limosus]|uniref:hypothetical protein n=1 Tax=Inquilinus limosus TaxID=171674 RepID=UPI003F16B083